MRKLFIICLLLSYQTNAYCYRTKPKTRPFKKSEINFLISSLVSDDWSKAKLEKTLHNKKFRKLIKVSSKNLTKPVKLTHNKYSHFMDSYAMKKANRFNRKWRTSLKNASTKFDVDDRTISSILLVETSYGAYAGKNPLFSVFATTFIDAEDILESSEYKTLEKKMQDRVKRKKTGL